MAMLVLDHWVEARVLAERKESGADHHDEVWDGVYVMSPLPNNDHQRLVKRFVFILESVIGVPGLGEVFPGVNVSDRDEGWTHNYRCPDVVVFLKGTSARDCGTYWKGGPDFLIEILSEDDRSRDKLPFYSEVGVREALLVDRDPWALELYRLQDGQLVLVGRSSLENPDLLTSEVVPLTFRLVPGESHPRIEVTHAGGVQRWEI